MISVNGISMRYGSKVLFDDVSVTFQPGRRYGLTGPNGAGKSTFMKLITGQLKPNKGAVRVLGEPIWGNHALYHRIGFCPEPCDA